MERTFKAVKLRFNKLAMTRFSGRIALPKRLLLPPYFIGLPVGGFEMVDLHVYEIEKRITLWKGAALILGIDPADAIVLPERSPVGSSLFGIGEIIINDNGEPSFKKDKSDAKYQHVMSAILNNIDDFEPEECFAGGTNLIHFNQNTLIDINALKKWSLSKGFKSEFLGNLPPEIETKQDKETTTQTTSTGEALNKTALKVIGLFMYDLSERGKKYTNNGQPNKSQIKDFLQTLATKYKIDDHGLRKVDERLLTNALNYFNEQKID